MVHLICWIRLSHYIVSTLHDNQLISSRFYEKLEFGFLDFNQFDGNIKLMSCVLLSVNFLLLIILRSTRESKDPQTYNSQSLCQSRHVSDYRPELRRKKKVQRKLKKILHANGKKIFFSCSHCHVNTYKVFINGIIKNIFIFLFIFQVLKRTTFF